MRTYDLDPKIRQALAFIIQDNNPTFRIERCSFAVGDVLDKGCESIYWDEVSRASWEYMKPLMALMSPVIRQILASFVPAIIVRSDEIINDWKEKNADTDRCEE